MNKIFLYVSIIFIVQLSYAIAKPTKILYCKTFDPHKIFNKNIPPYDKCFKGVSDTSYYKVFLSRNNRILKVEYYNSDNILQTTKTYNYKQNKPYYSKKVHLSGSNKSITFNYFFAINLQINTPNRTIANRRYYKKVSQYNDNALYQTSYYDKYGRLLVKLFYNKGKISQYKLRVFYKGKLDREIYYKGQGEYYNGKNRKWTKTHKWVNIFSITGQLEFSFYSFDKSNKVQYFIYYYNQNGSLIQKNQFSINKNKVLLLRNKIIKLKKNGIKRSVNIPRGIYFTPFLKQKFNYKNKVLILKGLISKDEVNYLVNIPKTKKSIRYRTLVKRMYRQLKKSFVPTKTKDISWYFKLNGKVDKIEYYKANNLSKVDYYDDNGNISKTDKYNWLGEKIFVEE